MNVKKRAFEFYLLRIDTGDYRPLWQKGTILSTKAGIYMYHISNEREYFSLSIHVIHFENKCGGRK